MRDLAFYAFAVAIAPLAIAMPHIGLYMWSWLSFAALNRETFGGAYEFHAAVWFAGATIGIWLLSGRPRFVFPERTTILFVLLFLWTGLTTATAIDPGWSYPYFVSTAKAFVLAIVALNLLNNRSRIQGMIWVIAVGIGYYAVKGMGFTLLTGGQFHVLGPAETAIGDNNTLGVAMVMTLPLLNYLRTSSRHGIVVIITTLVMLATIVAIIGTYSRGGLFALAIVGIFMWLRSRHKVILTVVAAGVLIALPTLVAPQWYERMSTIQSYASDASFTGRLEAWQTTIKLVEDRPLVGGGYNATQIDSVFRRYNASARYQGGTAAHNVFFQVLGDHGIVGVALYLALIIVGFLNLNEAQRAAKRNPDLWWAGDLAGMIQVTFIGLLSAGALLSMAYYEVFLVLLALSGRLRLAVLEPATAGQGHQPNWHRDASAALAQIRAPVHWLKRTTGSDPSRGPSSSEV